MNWKLSLPTSNKGFTVIELLVSMVIGLIMVSIAVSTVLSGKDSYQTNLIRTRMSQNVRGALDILGTNIKQAGERLPDNVPAIELVNGASGAPDQLILRRNILGEVLTLCEPINIGTQNPVVFGNYSTTPGCDYAAQDAKYNAWRNHRLANTITYGFIINTATKQSEIFEYRRERKTGSRFFIRRRAAGGGNWQHNYPVGNTSVYLIEQWNFSLQADPVISGETILSVVENDDTSNPLHLAPAINDLQIEIELKDGSVVQSLAATDDWSNIKNLDVTITSEETHKGKVYKSELNAKFFPRNILSL